MKNEYCNKKYVCVLGSVPLLPNSGFVLDEKFQRNASKFAIFHVYKKAELLFPFFILCYSIFSPNKCQQLWVFVDTKYLWQILKCFAGTFRRAQILKLGGVPLGPTSFKKNHLNRNNIILRYDGISGRRRG